MSLEQGQVPACSLLPEALTAASPPIPCAPAATFLPAGRLWDHSLQAGGGAWRSNGSLENRPPWGRKVEEMKGVRPRKERGSKDQGDLRRDRGKTDCSAVHGLLLVGEQIHVVLTPFHIST